MSTIPTYDATSIESASTIVEGLNYYITHDIYCQKNCSGYTLYKVGYINADLDGVIHSSRHDEVLYNARTLKELHRYYESITEVL